MSTGNILEEIIPRHILEKLTVVELKKKVVFIPLEEQKDIELYYILEGQVSCFTVDFNGREFLVDSLGPGEFIGKFSQMRNMNFNCGVRTATDCKLLRLTPCKKELLSDKNFSLYFYLKTSDRVYEMYKLAMLRMLFPSNEVLAYWLLKLAKDGTNIEEKAESICLQTNISKRQFFYCIKNFCDEGLIEKSGKQINILDKDGLKDIAGNVYLFMNENKKEDPVC